jgi:hypothetical protein
MWVYMVLNKGTVGVEAWGYVDNVSVTAPNDSDIDGCSDGEELSPNPLFGGDRDPNSPWDFFDVNGSRAVDVADVVAILGHFGQGTQHPDYDATYDRYIPDIAKPWRTAAATGTALGIDVSDALANLQSFGHSCAG